MGRQRSTRCLWRDLNRAMGFRDHESKRTWFGFIAFKPTIQLAHFASLWGPGLKTLMFHALYECLMGKSGCASNVFYLWPNDLENHFTKTGLLQKDALVFMLCH